MLDASTSATCAAQLCKQTTTDDACFSETHICYDAFLSEVTRQDCFIFPVRLVAVLIIDLTTVPCICSYVATHVRSAWHEAGEAQHAVLGILNW